MSTQSEQVLENQLIDKLVNIGYTKVAIPDEPALLANLKLQLEKHNKISFTPNEFARVLNTLSKGTIFEKAKTLREKQHIFRDNGENLYFEFINIDHWCQNEYQVTNQVTVKGRYDNRYDVTLLINGLPLVQIELKRSGLEIKEAFNQIERYQKHSYGSNAALFQYIQLFVISNGVNTKYFANNRELSHKQTFYWTDVNNNRLSNIFNGFTSEFLDPCHISKMICKYIVLNETNNILMVLRPYQYYAVESIIDKVQNSNSNGYIWHTTGSGKTLTSFKASQIIMKMPHIKKVVFVVDRKDLDYQTTKEFNSFSKGSIDGTDNTRALVKQFGDNTPIIVTTIQKLNTAISSKRHLSKMEKLKEERIVFIFDECHRSQFGDTHNRIKAFFNNFQMFGFTGTPIFAENAVTNELGKRTTTELFGNCLHKYVITDAIKDENVLRFSVEYVGRYKKKDTANEIDIEVEDINRKELIESPKRLEKIVDYIIDNHSRKTHDGKFNAMFCVGSTDMLVNYYDIFKRKRQEGLHDLKIATIFSYVANEDNSDLNSYEAEEEAVFGTSLEGNNLHKHKRDKLESYMEDYYEMFGTRYTTRDSQSYYNYYNDISKRVKNRNIDILLVVNMFLTGFDSKKLNTLYVDKNLKYHGLIQAYSRTNRIDGDLKSQGNIIVFRNLKEATDDAITLFSNKEAIDTILMQPYENYTELFNEAYKNLLAITPTVNSVNDLMSEADELNFVKAFRELMRLRNTLNSFSDFGWEDLEMEEQTFNNFRSKYLDLWEKSKNEQRKEMASILNDLDFELELIHRDEINVTYILKLLAEFKGTDIADQSTKRKQIQDILTGEANLRSKRALIEKFIEENLPLIEDPDKISREFDSFWAIEQQKAFNALVIEEKLSSEKTQKLIEDYLYQERMPISDKFLELLEGDRPSVLLSKAIAKRLSNKIKDFIDTFILEAEAA